MIAIVQKSFIRWPTAGILQWRLRLWKYLHQILPEVVDIIAAKPFVLLSTDLQGSCGLTSVLAPGK